MKIALLVMLFLCSLIACSLKPGERIVTIQTQIDPAPAIPHDASRLTVTSSSPQIDCYIANIMGSDIESMEMKDDEIGNNGLYLGRAMSGKPCAYPGKISGPLSAAQLTAGQFFNFTLLSSPNARRLQVLGISDPENYYCSQPYFSRDTLAESDYSEFGEFYEMGAETFTVGGYQTEQTIGINNVYASRPDLREKLRINRAECKFTPEQIAARTDVTVLLEAITPDASPSDGDQITIRVTARPSTAAVGKHLSVMSPYYEANVTPRLATGNWYLDSSFSSPIPFPVQSGQGYMSYGVEYSTHQSDGKKYGIRRSFTFTAAECVGIACVKDLYFQIDNSLNKSKIAFTARSNDNPTVQLDSVYSTNGARLILDLTN